MKFIKLFQRPSNNEAYGFMDGLRSIAILWIVASHTIGLWAETLSQETVMDGIVHSPYNWFWSKGFLAVNTFFVLSGFLTTRLLLNNENSLEPKSSFKLILNRILRLIPQYYVLLLISGGFTLIYPEIYNTENYWSYFLFLQNYFPLQKTVAAWTWYLSIEVQFFIAYVFIFKAIRKFKLNPTGSLLILILVSLIYTYYRVMTTGPFILTYVYNHNPEEFFKFLNSTYTNTLCRSSSLLMGALAGFWVDKPSVMKFFENKKAQFLLIGIGLVYSFAILYPGFNPPSGVINPPLTNTLLNPSFGVYSLFLILLLLTRNSLLTPLKKFLSWKLWVPVSALSYGIYLFHHPLIQTWVAFFTPLEFSFLKLYPLTLGVLILSSILSLVALILVEAPMRQMRKKFLND